MRDKPPAEGGMAPIYGATATLPSADVAGMLRAYMDLWCEI
ncbi:MAG TPA: hypothetical protein VHR88_05040 [Solirubrobacteraceae bacterium]|nr:hypothetical protein [Solirubrobacteraceae bacterium]